MIKILSIENRENVVIIHEEVIKEEGSIQVVDIVATCVCATCGKKYECKNFYFPEHDKFWKESMEAWIRHTLAKTECDDCEHKRVEKEREEEIAKKAKEEEERKTLEKLGDERLEAARANGLYSDDMEKMPDIAFPELEGTEKQVDWVKNIRNYWYESAKKAYADAVKACVRKPIRDGMPENINYDDLKYGYDFIVWIANHTDARWWIDNRDELSLGYRWIGALRDEYHEEKTLKESVKEETIVIPEERKHDGVANIRIDGDSVSVYYPKNEDFRKLVKSLGYYWNERCWTKNISLTTGTAQERSAELGNKLLKAGFAINITDADVRKRAINAEYEPEHLRWVTCNAARTKFRLKFEFGQNIIYNSARKIKGSKYEKPYVSVPLSEYDAVLGLAHEYGFRLSPGAKEEVKRMQNAGNLKK